MGTKLQLEPGCPSIAEKKQMTTREKHLMKVHWLRLRAHTFSYVTAVAVCLVTMIYVTPSKADKSYPARVVKVIVPSAPGGATDIVARLLSKSFSETIGGSFVVENRPGAGSMIGTAAVAEAKPDGYTLLIAASTITSLHVARRNMPYDAVKDFVPISKVISLTNVIVAHPSFGAHNLSELINLAKNSSPSLAFASPGIASNAHISMEALANRAGIKFLHVPYNGLGHAMNDVIAGRIPLTLGSVGTVRGYINEATLRPIAVTGLKRVPAFPDVATVDEMGLPGFVSYQWLGLFAPRGTPADIISKLNKAVITALNSKPMLKYIDTSDGDAVGNRPEEFENEIKAEVERWTDVAKAAGIKPK